MLMFLYHFGWSLASLFVCPWVGLWMMGGKDRGDSGGMRSRVAARMAMRFPHPPPRPGGIWVHALSVGEVISALPLVDGLAGEFPEREIVFTAATTSGLAVAREKLGSKVGLIFPMPLDAWWAVRKVLDFVRPSAFILVETDIWPCLLASLRRRGVPSLLVNGRVSPRTLRSYLRAPCLVRKMMAPLCACLMQTDLDRDRLLMTGMAREKVITVGNIKFDRHTDPMGEGERREWFNRLHLEPSARVWVAGSTHEGEEEIILHVFQRLKVEFPRLRLILAPRNPGRAHDIIALAAQRGLKALRRSDGPGPSSGDLNLPGDRRGWDLMVVDTVGELARIYGIGSVTFVGGSLVPFGGHNLLEPAAFGIPVLFGPYTHNFVRMAEELLEEGGGCLVHSGEELYTALHSLLADEDRRRRIGSKARAFVMKNRGALERVLFHVRRCLRGDREPGPQAMESRPEYHA